MRNRPAALLAALLAAGLLAASGCGGDEDENAGGDVTTTDETGAGAGTLQGSVGPGFEIRLENTEGVTPGTYTLVVDDMSSSHNFHLTGPGVDVKTDVGFEGEKTFTVDLQAGEYQFVCDPHASSMNGSFTVAG
jgi:copper binding plastocyanin/azurin family protein